MEMEQVNKVVRLNENPIGNEEKVKVYDGGDERDENELSDMDKLPPEILTTILDYLDEQQLVKCRLLSSRWNEISCLLLQDETKSIWCSKLVVGLRKSDGKESLKCVTVITRSFDEFLDCFAPSEAEKSSGRRRPFPFSRFKIADLLFMEMNQMTRFVSLFAHIKKLTLDIKEKDVENFGIFWRLLLKFAPNIEHLELVDYHWCKVNLFEPHFNFKANSDPFLKANGAQNQDETFLNKLKVLEITVVNMSAIDMHVANFLEHAPNVQKLYHESLYFVKIWQQLNRTHLLKKLEIKSNCKSHLSPAELMKNVQLEKLRADCNISTNPVGNKKSTINYINHALKSSKNTLSSLSLRDLAPEIMNFCFKDIKSLPNLRQLRLDEGTATRNMVDRFSHVCPNLTSLDLGFIESDFSNVARILWTGFKGLKSLNFVLQINCEEHDMFLVDSAISGYSQESIQKIQTKLELDDGISVEEARRGEKQNPSILDLKGLSRVEIKLFMYSMPETRKKVESQLRNSIFMKILPQHLRENPTSILFN